MTLLIPDSAGAGPRLVPFGMLSVHRHSCPVEQVMPGHEGHEVHAGRVGRRRPTSGRPGERIVDGVEVLPQGHRRPLLPQSAVVVEDVGTQPGRLLATASCAPPAGRRPRSSPATSW